MDDLFFTEGFLSDNDKIRDNINNYDKQFASDQDFINKFKSITRGYEIIGIPFKTVIAKYGVEVSKTFTIFCYKTEDIVYKVSVTITCLSNSGLMNPKCSSVKAIKFNKNANKKTFFSIAKKCADKAVIHNILSSSKKITIFFVQTNTSFLEGLSSGFYCKYNKITKSISIYNKLNFKESANINEMTPLASMNPIKGTMKPYILKLEPMSSVFSGNNFAFSPDIVSDKYLVINENDKLQIVDSEYLENCKYSIYEFTGDELRLASLYRAYKEQQTVPRDFIYTCLSGRNMLSNDQINYDEQFKMIDIDKLSNTVRKELERNE